MKKPLALLFCICLGFCFGTAQAQPERVDSVLSLLRAAPKQGRVDTVLMKKIRPVLSRVVLTEEGFQKIITEANQFVSGNEEDMSFLICYWIFLKLENLDLNKSIDFGKLMLERIQKSKSAEKHFFQNSFLSQMRFPYRNSDRLSEGFQYYSNYLIRFNEANDSSGIAVCHYVLSGFYRTIGLFDKAIYHTKKSAEYLDSTKDASLTYFGMARYNGKFQWLNNWGLLGEYYFLKRDTKKSIVFTREYFELQQKRKNNRMAFPLYRMAKVYLQANLLDSAAYWIQKSYEESIKADKGNLANLFQTWSLLELKKGQYDKADSLLIKSWEIVNELTIPANSAGGIIDPDYYRALIRIEQKKYAEATGFLVSDIKRIQNFRFEILRDYKLLAEIYDKMGEAKKSIESYKVYVNLQDSLFADQNKFNAISFETEQEMKAKELSINQLKTENKISSLTRNFSFGIIGLILLLAGGIYYRYKSKEKANAILQKTLANLHATQSQLIQSEKMASLGELTAGIAHEIQNPLNFVNNFSELNTELVDELEQEIVKGNTGELGSILQNIKDNESKINFHGKRADAIVKGMLQHSRNSSDVKTPTDINKLTDEYLRLAYHGLRAKDKSFNAAMVTRFDETIGMVTVNTQDIGRVILNLITNAFYAVAEKAASINNKSFHPTVTISTRKNENYIEISVKDNGNGISQKIREKIFQPFFTTKPTGQGTGLGLSMSYDIITKGHGGKLLVDSKEGEYAEFTIVIPV